MIRKALIIGSNGQDGRLLSMQLAEKGYSVIGCTRTEIGGDGLPAAFNRPLLDSPEWVDSLIATTRPQQVYYLAALHHSAEQDIGNDCAALVGGLAVNTLSLAYVLEAIRKHSPDTRLFYAASSHIFGMPETSPQNEDTPINPTTPYGISKAAGLFTCRRYRQAYGQFAITGILYNHESIYRPAHFLSSKITQGVAAIKSGKCDHIVLGDLDTVVDWGYAPDFTRAMQAMLSMDQPEDFVVATGIPHTVREFADIAFSSAGMDYRQYVRIDTSIIKRQHGALLGDSTRLQRATGWTPTIEFKQMVRELVSFQLNAKHNNHPGPLSSD